MKKLIALIFVITILCSFCSCFTYEDPALSSLGEYSSKEFYSHGGFQDYTDYGKYYFESVDFTDNEYFKHWDMSTLLSFMECLDDFEKMIDIIKENNENDNLVNNYDFDSSIVDDEDYFYIESKTHTWEDGSTSLTKYDVYFYDIQSNVLYYFHNNI
ncbi:MAG: hypothetical protein II984_11470 [Clostridia bacterium]|nr:hypothetical protein [Clostridia bacterium]